MILEVWKTETGDYSVAVRAAESRERQHLRPEPTGGFGVMVAAWPADAETVTELLIPFVGEAEPGALDMSTVWEAGGGEPHVLELDGQAMAEIERALLNGVAIAQTILAMMPTLKKVFNKPPDLFESEDAATAAQIAEHDKELADQKAADAALDHPAAESDGE